MIEIRRALRTGLICCALLLAAAIAVPTLTVQPAYAGVKPPKAKTHQKGKVTAVDTTANTITIEHGKQPAHTFTVTKETAITVDGASGKGLADVTTGMHAKVTTDKKTPVDAVAIDAKSAKKKKK